MSADKAQDKAPDNIINRTQGTTNTDQPNILVFMTDQQRWDTVYPYNRAKTPNFDRLAQESRVFTHAFCPAPHCCPSRASFFSGLYPTGHGVWNNVDVGNALSKGLAPGTRLFSQDLADGGYNCLFSGKWHLSALEGPGERGFSKVYNYGLTYGPEGTWANLDEWDVYYRNNQWAPMGKVGDQRRPAEILRPGYPLYTQYGINPDPFGDRVTVQNALEMLDSVAQQTHPFFLFTGTQGPHDPYMVPQEFLDWYKGENIELPPSFADTHKDKPNLHRRLQNLFRTMPPDEHRQSLRHYLALCSYEDYLFGLLVDRVQKLPGRTIIFYLSDHGDYAGDHGLWTKGLPCFESAYRVPLLIHDTANPEGQICHEFVSLTDLAPTILDFAGIPYDQPRFSGTSLKPLLSCSSGPLYWRDKVFTQTNGNELYGIQRSVRTRDYLLVYNGFDFDEFYDLRRDPDQMVNEINNPKYTEEIQNLYKELWTFAWNNDDRCINPYIMVGLAPYGPGTAFE